MREIKFKAYVPGKGWIQGFNLINFHNYYTKGLEPKLQRYDSEWNLSDIHLVQYTGLKDKNGKEIYEGDILAGYRSGKRTINNDSVVFEAGKFKLKYTPGDLIQFTYSLSEYQCEVIGNIYENPELLQP